MECTIDTKDLKRSMSVASKLLSDFESDACLLTADKKDITLVGKSESCWFKTSVKGSVAKPGSFSTDFSVLLALKVTGENTELSSAKGNQIKFKCGRSSWELSSKDHKSYDLEPHEKVKLTHKFTVKTLKSLFETLTYDSDVVEANGSKPIKFKFNGKMFITSTNDSYTFGYVEEKDTLKNTDKFEVLLPADTMAGLLGMLPNSETIEFGINKNFVRFKSSLLDIVHSYQAPDSDKIVDIEGAMKELKDSKNKIRYKISNTVITGVLEEIGSFSRDNIEDARVTLSFDKAKKKCSISFKNSIGSIKSHFALIEANKDHSAQYSLFLLKNILSQLEGDIMYDILTDGRVLITDANNITFGLVPLVEN